MPGLIAGVPNHGDCALTFQGVSPSRLELGAQMRLFVHGDGSGASVINDSFSGFDPQCVCSTRVGDLADAKDSPGKAQDRRLFKQERRVVRAINGCAGAK